ncbi:MAG: glycosyltransferase [Acidobacteriota bacterium]
MWILILLFGLATLVLAWTLFGYFLLIWFMGLFRRQPQPALPETDDQYPRVSLVVPLFNERDEIEAKLTNLRELSYPQERMEVVFVDGGSTDGTVEWLETALADLPRYPRYRVERSPRDGKINQLNHVLPDLSGEIVVNTDADASMEPDALAWIAAEFAVSDDVWVVGAYCRPGDDAYCIDQYYWDAQNKGRLIECQASTSSIVIAPCYAFRRELLDRFPEDVVADDIYIAFLANVHGKQSIYSRHARAVEQRNPRRLSEFLPHKYRKSNAFLRESLRFLYRLPEMEPLFKTMLLTRIAQQLVFPWARAWWLLLAGSLATLYPMPRYDVVGIAAAGLVMLFGFTSRAFRSVELPEPEQRKFSLFMIAKGWILTTLILLATGLSYPFYRQSSSYARLGDPASGTDATEGTGTAEEKDTERDAVAESAAANEDAPGVDPLMLPEPAREASKV